MADLSKSVSDTIHIIEDVGQNLCINGDFESAPSFTAATTTTSRWIDGTAGGSTTDDTHQWALPSGGTAGTFAAQFDTSDFHTGLSSMKVSTVATSSSIDVSHFITANAAGMNRYGIPGYGSAAYKCQFWMKVNTISGTSSDGSYITVVDRNASGTSVGTHVSSKVKITTGWTQYTISFTSTSTTIFFTISLTTKGNTGTATLIQDAWFDDITLSPVSLITGVDLPLLPLVTPGIQNISSPKIWS